MNPNKAKVPSCPPCTVDTPFIPQAIPEMVCQPCPTETPREINLLPEVSFQVVETDCLEAALHAMFNTFYCKIPPRGCK